MATPTHKKSGKKKTKAFIENMPDIPEHDDKGHSVPYYVAPHDTVNLNDSVVEVLTGTSTDPIYVSDYEDCSEVAIKGERLPNPVRELPGPPKLQDISLESEEDDGESTVTPLFDDLLAPAGEAKKKSPRKSLQRSSTTTPSTSASDFSFGTNMALASNPGDYLNATAGAAKSTAGSIKTEKAKNKKKGLANKLPFGKKKNKKASGGNPDHIDLTGVVDLDLDEDLMLERELEEIALNGGRAGLISGTPGAYDVEHGKGRRFFGKKKKKNTTTIKVAHKPRYRDDPSVTYVDEEDALDLSWHGTVSKHDPNKKRWTKKRIIWTALEVGLVVIMISLLISLLVKRSKQPKPGDPLTPEQQQIHDTLARVTGPKILTDPSTPQYLARIWLLYEDDEVWSASEEGVIQRYALATFHFATGGGDRRWFENNWLIGPECGSATREPWVGLNCSPEGKVRALLR
ncbi:MAG: hypothetical protein SGARI_004467 [Bacillariaceae sp.]